MKKFSRYASRLARPLELRPPIDPRVSDVATAKSHPLWQFFHDQQMLRTPSQVSEVGNSWTIPQLRRKSFDDLHSLWFVCLKEWNKLARESAVIHQLESRPGQDTDPIDQPNRFEEAIDKIKSSMQNIRHVLAERHHGQIRGKMALNDNYSQLLAEFSREFLEADSNADAEVTGQMERFQYAMYGINPFLEDNFPHKRLIEGLYTMSKLKLQRYSESSDVTSINDIREAFLIFTCEHSPEGVAEAIETILEVRAANEPIDDETKVLAELMFSSRAEVPEAEAELATESAKD